MEEPLPTDCQKSPAGFQYLKVPGEKKGKLSG